MEVLQHRMYQTILGFEIMGELAFAGPGLLQHLVDARAVHPLEMKEVQCRFDHSFAGVGFFIHRNIIVLHSTNNNKVTGFYD